MIEKAGAALGIVLALRFHHSDRFRCCRSRASKLADGREHFPPMPERDTEFFEVLIGQVGQDRGVDVVLGKALGVLGHAELFEPVGNLVHRGAPRGSMVAYAELLRHRQ